MDETTIPQPEEHKASEADIAYLEEARNILTIDGYIPKSKIENARLDGMPTPTRFDSRGHGPHEALNNFMMLFTGAVKPDDAPEEELQGRSYGDLFRDLEEIVADLGLDISKLKEAAVSSRDVGVYDEGSLYDFYVDVLPVFEKLVRDKGYSVDSLKM